ncbi:SRPBCC family protein [Pseudaminobacter sp. 19-2017]|uniref:SRPBCC family protein n=1 Tax=Pseudaminobacter soli (ex Zhang et al. 2022) TaxID=2831468 RepID=A0A942DXM4_9HYPH|nr:SRPBCC family protein [Pseudaminobacter soli]MBS3649724.1 SRPBCC family protein [Pseudaminobacter soli]
MSNDRIERTIELTAPIERVWRALTEHTEFGAWFRVRLDGPFVLGHVTTGQMTYPGFEHYRWYCHVTRLEPPHLFAFTWPHPGDLTAEDHSGEPMTLVEFRLEPTASGTRLTVTESGFAALREDRRMEALRGNEQGWQEQLGNIRAYVQG